MFKFVAATLLLAACANSMHLDMFDFRGKPYVIVSNEKASWFDAESFCIARGLELASIDDQPEFDYIKGQLVGRGLQNTQVWIGGTEIGTEDSYYWTNTGLPVDLPQWDETEIVDVKNRCMVFYKSKWRHHLCTAVANFVCESPTPATTLPPTTTTVASGR